MTALTRRHLLAAGGAGAAATALGACGEEVNPREEGRDPELLTAALGAETALHAAYEDLPTPNADAQAAVRAFIAAQRRRIDELEELGAESSQAAGEAPAGSEDAAMAAANTALAAYRDSAGLLSTAELRAVAIRNLAAVAAELAVLRAFGGEDPAPRAFVTGSGEEPFVAESTEADDD